MTLANRLAATAAALTLAAPLAAQPQDENDVLVCRPTTSPAELATGGIVSTTGAIEAPVRIFAVALAPIDGAPGFYGDEGFFGVSSPGALPAGYTVLPDSADVRFDLKAFSLGGQAANLWYWDPAVHPQVAFEPASNGLTVTYQKSPAGFFHATADGAAGDVAGFTIDRTGTGGFLHRHLTIVAGQSLPGQAVPAGIYLVSLGISIPGAAAPPIYEIINGNLGAAGEAAVGMAAQYLDAWLNPPPCPGDVDGDGAVGLSDLATLLANFGLAGGATRAMGDVDSDGDVDLADLSTLLANFGQPCS